MGRLAVVVTSPRLPAGLLTHDAWRAIEAADLVASRDIGCDLVPAVTAAGVEVVELPAATAPELVALAERQDVVWLAADDGEPELTTMLADLVVRRSETGRAGPAIEVIVGSFDPVGARLLDAVTVMDALRRECPWDREQTHRTLVPYLVEETYEVIEAIDSLEDGLSQAPELLCEELGDLLLQVLFHARLAGEYPERPFSIDEVAAGLVAKLVRRHPHVFSDVSVAGAEEVASNWEQIKQAEKLRDSAVDGIPPGLPALQLADQVIRRALRAQAQLSVPAPEGESAYTEETLGEVLFALVAAAHAGGLDAEQALRARVRREIATIRRAETSERDSPQ